MKTHAYTIVNYVMFLHIFSYLYLAVNTKRQPYQKKWQDCLKSSRERHFEWKFKSVVHARMVIYNMHMCE